jgi:hypothetical protein
MDGWMGGGGLVGGKILYHGVTFFFFCSLTRSFDFDELYCVHTCLFTDLRDSPFDFLLTLSEGMIEYEEKKERTRDTFQESEA